MKSPRFMLFLIVFVDLLVAATLTRPPGAGRSGATARMAGGVTESPAAWMEARFGIDGVYLADEALPADTWRMKARVAGIVAIRAQLSPPPAVTQIVLRSSPEAAIGDVFDFKASIQHAVLTVRPEVIVQFEDRLLQVRKEYP